MKNRLLPFLLAALLFGCAAPKGTPLLQGTTLQGDPVCLANPEGIPEIVRKFFATRDLTTEEGKIDYLLERVRKSDLIFIRNKVEHDGRSAAEFLRWKLNRLERRYGIEVKTAQGFITHVASGSRVSGEPYSVTLSDGTHYNLQDVLQNELSALEFCLKQYEPKAEAAEPPSAVPPSSNTASTVDAGIITSEDTSKV